MTVAASPTPGTGSGLPILGQLSLLARVSLLATIAVSVGAVGR